LSIWRKRTADSGQGTAMRYAERFNPDAESLASFIKSRNGINGVAARFSKRISSPGNKTPA
jgi:hypothetical protein